MEGHSWEGVLLDTFRLHSGGHVFLIEPIQSLKQEIRVDPEAGQDDDGPDDPGGSGLSAADVGETMDRCGGEKSICFLLKASNSHLFHKLYYLIVLGSFRTMNEYFKLIILKVS